MTSLIHLQPPEKKARPYKIHVGAGMLQKTAEIVAKVGTFDTTVVLYDFGVEDIAFRLKNILPAAQFIGVHSGDSSKSLKEVERIAKQMLKLQCTRRTILITVGGGMISDLGGFVASIFMRGIPCVHIPTTLLGMVDASVGGKTGVNLGSTKNILGTIHHPRAIIVDTDIAKALPDAQLRDGMTEVVKIGAVRSTLFFEWLEKNLNAILAREDAALHHAIAEAIGLKAKTVEQDDNDTLVRLLLNFGHTVGHAIEALSGFTLSHGQAIAVGMVAEMNMVKFVDTDRVQRLLVALGMPVSIPADYTPKQIWDVMKRDKKNEADSVRIAIPQTIGHGIVCPITQEEFMTLFR